MTKNEFVVGFVKELAAAQFNKYPDPSWYPDPDWLIGRAIRLADALERAGYFR